MLTYILYKKVAGFPYVRTCYKIKVKEPLRVGERITYNQFGIFRGYVTKCSFDSNEFKVFIEV